MGRGDALTVIEEAVGAGRAAGLVLPRGEMSLFVVAEHRGRRAAAHTTSRPEGHVAAGHGPIETLMLRDAA